MNKNIGDRIKDARLKAGISQEELGKSVGVSRAAVSQWESGQTKGLKPENLILTADRLGVSERWLAVGEGPRHPDDKRNGIREELPEYIDRLARLIAKAPPDKAMAMLTLMGASKKDIEDLSKTDRRSGERRHNVQKIDFERRSGLDRRDDDPFTLEPGETSLDQEKKGKRKEE